MLSSRFPSSELEPVLFSLVYSGSENNHARVVGKVPQRSSGLQWGGVT